MADPIIVKQNDNRPTYVATLKDNFGLTGEAPIDLTTATTVKFIMRSSGLTGADPAKVDADMTITDPANGIVTYTWQGDDLDTADTYSVEFEIHWADGGVETIPNNGYLTLIVDDDLG